MADFKWAAVAHQACLYVCVDAHTSCVFVLAFSREEIGDAPDKQLPSIAAADDGSM